MLKIEKYTENDSSARQWDNFVDLIAEENIFYKRQFLNYHPKGRFKDHSLVVKDCKIDQEAIVALIPAVEVEQEEFGVKHKVFFSHPGSSMASIISKSGFVQLSNVVDLLLSYIIKNNIKKVIFRLPCPIYNNQMDQSLEFVFYKKQFTVLQKDLTSVVNLSKLNHDLIKDFKQENRTSIRKAKKNNVEIRRVGFCDKFFQILQNNLANKGSKPTHTLEELKYLYKEFPNNLETWVAISEEKIIGGISCWRVTKKIVLTFYIAQDYRYQKYRPLNFLIYRLMKYYKENGFLFLDFGTITTDGSVNLGLSRFKESFNAGHLIKKTMVWRQ